ncbi:MAG: undecaprenyl/decaprenyl-phosphate alpha-N-acetylglucosaminyl 1-phosphate transferase [Tannerella sp.]|jgi:UDP-N-acetylmuramyl pentapeptide phosphotransferase/UDP-N-acetylglucosamine-1-phosphate transferase|nr:undecaprenyl/decaprenyl-phosphate alpha-N-acetylglucosaminyl 1-phosphate transferase [Tannerella sp.]
MVLAMLVIPKILVIAARHSLYDVSDDRKTHEGAIPRIGGVSFVPCILFAMMFTLGIFYQYPGVVESHGYYPNHSDLYLFFCGLIFLYLGGVKDDLVGLRYRHKFAIQIISSLLIVFSGLYINNVPGFLEIYRLTPWIGALLTIIVLVFITNAMNLIDGIDGLASGLSIFALCVYGTLFHLNGLWSYAVLAFSTVGVLIPFFYYNVFGNVNMGRKLFMGDSGSLTLGFILGFLAVRYACFQPDVIRPIGNILVFAVSPILIPILDVMRVILVRIKKRKHLFIADRSHIHHKLMDMGLSKSFALILILSLNTTFCIINFILIQYISCIFIFMIDILLWSVANIYFSNVVKKKNNVVKRKNNVVKRKNMDVALFKDLI